jgi:hypothetical protein
MDHQATQLEHVAAAANNNATSSIDFHSVMNLNDSGNKPIKLDIDSSVTERPGAGKGGTELVSVNERVMLTEKGHAVPEHVLNNLILTEHGHNVRLNDNTIVVAGGPSQHKDHGEAMHKPVHAAVLPNLTIENGKK